jgi:hypothetical protein
MNERNDGSWLELDESNADLTCNVELRFALTPDDEQLWNTMDSVPWASWPLGKMANVHAM